LASKSSELRFQVLFHTRAKCVPDGRAVVVEQRSGDVDAEFVGDAHATASSRSPEQLAEVDKPAVLCERHPRLLLSRPQQSTEAISL
jgi:hypothetical protein